MKNSVIFSVQMAMCLVVFAFNSAAAQSGQSKTAPPASKKAAAEVRGIWSGTFYSKHSNVPPFSITVEINQNADGHLVGTSSLSSDCLRGTKLQVTVDGSNVVLAGSDEDGDNITVRGTVDASGVVLNSSYILNGSATGRCETDDGTGDLAKR
jgi:hypothetical protein